MTTVPRARRGEGWARRLALGIAVVTMVVAVAAVGWMMLNRASCEQQMSGEGANRLGANCGYQLAPSELEFRFAIDQGVERILYISGGTARGPEQIRLLKGATVTLERRTVPLTADSVDVCRNQPPRDHRWWSDVIDAEAAAAIRQGDTSVYRLEARVDGQWQEVRLHDSGCTWKGALTQRAHHHVLTHHTVPEKGSARTRGSGGFVTFAGRSLISMVRRRPRLVREVTK